MKTQNAPENKAKFFALYWGQKVLVLDGLASNVDSWIDGNNIKSFTLLLKPLSAISDEDRLNAEAILSGQEHSLSDLISDITSPKIGLEYIDDSGYGFKQVLNCFDFLRSKGYLIGWLDLTPEDIIACGWARLEEQG